MALSELNGTKKEKQGVCRETHLLQLKSFSLLNSGLYTIDYQLFIITVYPDGPSYARHATHYSRIFDIHMVSSWSS